MLKAVLVDKDYGSVTPEEQERVKQAYAQAGIELELLHLNGEDEIIEAGRGAFAILGTGNPPITEKVLSALPELRYVQRFGIGVNSIDLDACARHNVVVLNLPGFCIQELADICAGMILALYRNLGFYDRHVRRGEWPKCQYLLPPNVREKTLGLYGFGGTSKYLYQILHDGFGSKVIAHDPYVPESVKQQYSEVEFVSFEELLTRSDIISMHVPLNKETYHVFNKEAFRKMKNTAMILNVSRGPLIDEEALVWALQNGEILYAGLDCTETEPLQADSPLLQMENVIITPHSGSYGERAKRLQIDWVCELLPNAVLRGEIPAKHVANRAVMQNVQDIRFLQ